MSCTRRSARARVFPLVCAALTCAALTCAAAVVIVEAGGVVAVRAAFDQPQAADVEWVAPEELKNKLSGGEPLAIIDVRSTEGYVGSDSKIKGAQHVRLRRLRTRLAQSPLKDLPRDREVVTYCACPNDEAAVRAAQLFLAAGFKRVRVLKGGWQAWLAARGQVEPKPRG
ncbi:MAG TPA: rhodanese-like domain-containing protein [Pyrinomonadaceae bacterium]|nr:rhodanese-like domain-containing protein [Pyrinomonadaceae bacterium]